MDQRPLVTDEINAGAELVREFGKLAPIKTAFWIKPSNRNYRRLYIASDQINDSSIIQYFGEMAKLVRDKIRSPYLDFLTINLVNGQVPLAQAAAHLNQRYPNRTIPLQEDCFGGVYIDDGLIYPMPESQSQPVALS